MEFIARKIVRNSDNGNGVCYIKVNPTTSKIQISSALRRQLNLEGKQIGFGYEPNAETATRAGLYVVSDEDTTGCTVSATGDTQSKYHCEIIQRIYGTDNPGEGQVTFTVNVESVPDNIQGTDVYWLLTGGVEEGEANTPQEEEEVSNETAIPTDAGSVTPDPVFPNGTV